MVTKSDPVAALTICNNAIIIHTFIVNIILTLIK